VGNPCHVGSNPTLSASLEPSTSVVGYSRRINPGYLCADMMLSYSTSTRFPNSLTCSMPLMPVNGELLVDLGDAES
jgi:hypothetical protein